MILMSSYMPYDSVWSILRWCVVYVCVCLDSYLYDKRLKNFKLFPPIPPFELAACCLFRECRPCGCGDGPSRVTGEEVGILDRMLGTPCQCDDGSRAWLSCLRQGDHVRG